jgi:hypothetical protein
MVVPKSICDFFNLRHDVKLSKSSILSKFYTYIRDGRLRNKYNKLLIHLDTGLKNLFNLHYVNTLDTTSLVQEINKLYDTARMRQIEETEEELLEKLELIREKKRLSEIELKRNYVFNQFVKNSNYYFTLTEAKHLIYYITEKDFHPIVTYLTINDRNLLASLQLLNRFTIEKQIRYEDTYVVIKDYLFSIDSSIESI